MPSKPTSSWRPTKGEMKVAPALAASSAWAAEKHKVTFTMIDSTGEMLRTQTGAIHEQAASSTIPFETLQRAFQNIYDTMDQIDQFKLQALGNMKQTVETLGKEVEKSKGYIARAEGVNQGKLENASSPLTPLELK